MNWIALVVVIFSAVVWCRRSQRTALVKGRKSRRPTAAAEVPDREKIKTVLIEGGLNDWIALVQKPLDPHMEQQVLELIVAHAYKERFKPEMRDIVLTYGRSWFQGFDRKESIAPKPDQRHPIQTACFKWLAIALEENRCFDEAVQVCEKALRMGIQDGTKTGFEGRIERLLKKNRIANQDDGH